MTRVKNKLIVTLLALVTAFSLTACVKQEDIDNAVTPLSEQITAINVALTEMQTLDTTLDGYIDTLENKVATLETDLAAVNTALDTLEENSATKTALTETKTALETEINAIKTDIATLKTKDTELDGKITALQTALSTEITDTEKWVEETYATKAACDILKTEINASIATLQGEIDGLERSVETLNTAVNALRAQVEENTSKIEDLENRLNCLEGKHAVDESKDIAYTYTFSESGSTSMQKYVCAHCGKEAEGAVSPSAWKVNDKITYVAKDDNSYVATVAEVTESKAVLVSDNSYTAANVTITTEAQVLALVEPVGARFPKSGEAAYNSVIKPWLMQILMASSNDTLSLIYNGNQYCYIKKNVDYSGTVTVDIRQGLYQYKTTYYYRYIWDVEFATAE